jgi:hypothetical protein
VTFENKGRLLMDSYKLNDAEEYINVFTMMGIPKIAAIVDPQATNHISMHNRQLE